MAEAIRNLISILDMSVEEIDHLIEVADDIVANHDDYKSAEGKSWPRCSLNRVPEQDSALKRLCWNLAAVCWAFPKRHPAPRLRAKV